MTHDSRRTLGITLVLCALSLANIAAGDFAEASKTAFASGTACYLDNSLKKNAYLTVHQPNGANTTLKLGANLAHPQVLRYTLRNAGCNIKIDHCYYGGHKSLVGNELHDALMLLGICPRRQYQQTVFAHEYMQNIPMKLALNTADDFRAFAAWLTSTVDLETYPHPHKPILLLVLADDPMLATLTAEDNAFIDEYFTRCEPTDYFNERWKEVMEQNTNLEGGRPEYRCETVCETLLRKTEKACNNFAYHDVTSGVVWKFASAIAAIVAYENVVRPLTRLAAGSICDCCSKASGKFLR